MTETRDYLSVTEKGCRRGKPLTELLYVCIHEADELLSPHTLKNNLEASQRIGAHIAIGPTGDVVYMVPTNEQVINIGTFNISKRTGKIVEATDENTIHVYISPCDPNKLFSNMSMISFKEVIKPLFENSDRDWSDIIITKWTLLRKEPTPYWWTNYPEDFNNFIKFLKDEVELEPEIVSTKPPVIEENGLKLSDPIKGPYQDIAHWCSKTVVQPDSEPEKPDAEQDQPAAEETV